MPNVEDLLRKAMEEGKFDNLPGKGKRIHLGDSNPHADREWELAYDLIKDSGFSLPWIETLHEIEADLEVARKDLRLAWEVYQDAQAKLGSTGFIAGDWERSQQAFRDKLTGLNKRIRDYNLDVPAVRFQRPILNYIAELQKITSG